MIRQHCKTSIFALLFFGFLISETAYSAKAQGLATRMGIGVKAPFYTNLPSLAAQYYPNEKFGLAAVLGIQTGDTDSKFGLMVKAHRIVFSEENMIFYMGAGAGLVSNKVSGTNNSGFELMGVLGTEFFFSGLPNLGFSFEAGIGVVSISSEVIFRTIGQSPISAGMIFYF